MTFKVIIVKVNKLSIGCVKILYTVNAYDIYS